MPFVLDSIRNQQPDHQPAATGGVETIMCKVTLDEWAHDHFRTPPSSNTLRRWAREGLITPAPVKHGRSYYVEADACYREPEPLPRVPVGSSLVNRIASARYGAQAA